MKRIFLILLKFIGHLIFNIRFCACKKASIQDHSAITAHSGHSEFQIVLNCLSLNSFISWHMDIRTTGILVYPWQTLSHYMLVLGKGASQTVFS